MPSRLTLAACVCGLVLSAAACGGRTDGTSPRGAGGSGATGAGAGAGAGGGSGASSGGPGGAGGTPGQTGPGGGAIAVQKTATKVDLLFDIDNSASMGDKQAYLAAGVPNLIARLVQPNCVNAGGTITGVANLAGDCPDPGSTAEFPPVHDLHIGIVSSALGPRLGDACPEYDPTVPASVQEWTGGVLDRHNDDQAHLLNRGADPQDLTNYTETPVADAPGPDDFLDWFPPPSVNSANAGLTPTGPTPVTDPTALQNDLGHLIVGVHQFGCGIESQLESWYRFLIQPDPYASIVKDKTGKFAQWSGVDTTILAQRADFLRPDSLVAIVVLTDENDSEVDVRSLGGTAWNFMSTQFNPPRGTSICLTDPGNPSCTSCAFGKNSSDPQCMTEGGLYTATNDQTNWGYDLNLRHVHEKQKYGVSVQFPIQRYVLGLTSPKVPNRDGEYPAGARPTRGSWRRTKRAPTRSTQPRSRSRPPERPLRAGTPRPTSCAT